MTSFKFFTAAIVAAGLAVHFDVANAASDPDQTAGDVLQFAIPATAFAVAYFKGDSEGEGQWLRNTGASVLLTETAKVLFDQTYLGKRPDGSHHAFPSGHTAFAASGAAFLTERYGWAYGAPAWALTAFVGYTRVDERDHRWRDVLAGAALSYGVGKLFVTPQGATHIAPLVGPDFLGLRWERSW